MKHFLSSELSVCGIVLACHVAPGKGDTVHRDRPSHGLALHMGGHREYIFASGRRLTVERGDIIYLPRGSSYTVLSRRLGDCYAINFRLAEEPPETEPFVFTTRNTAEFLESFRRAERLWTSKAVAYVTGCKSELYHILYLMQREYRMAYMSDTKRELIRPAVERIHERYDTEPLPVSELADLCGITPEYFRRLFRASFGTSPVKYINSLKIARARELIASGLYTVSEAATLSGYSDMSHFSREFKRAVGVPPSEYMKYEI